MMIFHNIYLLRLFLLTGTAICFASWSNRTGSSPLDLQAASYALGISRFILFFIPLSFNLAKSVFSSPIRITLFAGTHFLNHKKFFINYINDINDARLKN